MDINSLAVAVGAASSAATDGGAIHVIRAYIGPEVMMPVASAIAGVVGVALIFWQRITSMVRRTYRRVFSKEEDEVFADSNTNLDADTRN